MRIIMRAGGDTMEPDITETVEVAEAARARVPAARVPARVREAEEPDAVKKIFTIPGKKVKKVL